MQSPSLSFRVPQSTNAVLERAATACRLPPGKLASLILQRWAASPELPFDALPEPVVDAEAAEPRQ